MTLALATEKSALMELLEREHAALATDYVSRRRWDDALFGPLRMFLRRPGKSFRARLVELSCEVAGGALANLPPHLAFVVELVHAGSLIIDDIEDRSETRRGEPALHVSVGLPTALNVGNWLYFFPLTLITEAGLSPEVELAVLRQTHRSLRRCHEGQALDLSVDVSRASQREIPGIVAAGTRLKTGSLMELAAALGAFAAGCEPGELSQLIEFGNGLGVGLQMLDDLGGLTCESRREKGFEDLRLARPTWPWAWAAQDLDAVSFHKLQRMSQHAQATDDASELADALRAVVGEAGALRARAHLGTLAATLRNRFGDTAAVDSVEREIARLEASYV